MQTIEQAIRNKQLISFIYNGHHRLIEPHVLGIKSGVLQVLGYQIGGTSGSGGIPEWRRFDVHAADRLALEAQHFAGARPCPGHHSSWDQTILIVAP